MTITIIIIAIISIIITINIIINFNYSNQKNYQINFTKISNYFHNHFYIINKTKNLFNLKIVFNKLK